MAEAERTAILRALEQYQGDLARVASALEVSPTTLWRKMKRLDIRAGAPGDGEAVPP